MNSTLNIIKIILVIFITTVMMGTGATDVRRDCRKETGVTWKSLKKLKVGDFSQNDHRLKCYVKCFMKKNGIFSDKDVDIEKAIKHLPLNLQASSRKILQQCKKIKSGDLCDRAYQIAKCYFKAQPEVLKSVSMV